MLPTTLHASYPRAATPPRLDVHSTETSFAPHAETQTHPSAARRRQPPSLPITPRVIPPAPVAPPLVTLCIDTKGEIESVPPSVTGKKASTVAYRKIFSEAGASANAVAAIPADRGMHIWLGSTSKENLAKLWRHILPEPKASLFYAEIKRGDGRDDRLCHVIIAEETSAEAIADIPHRVKPMQFYIEKGASREAILSLFMHRIAAHPRVCYFPIEKTFFIMEEITTASDLRLITAKQIFLSCAADAEAIAAIPPRKNMEVWIDFHVKSDCVRAIPPFVKKVWQNKRGEPIATHAGPSLSIPGMFWIGEETTAADVQAVLENKICIGAGATAAAVEAIPQRAGMQVWIEGGASPDAVAAIPPYPEIQVWIGERTTPDSIAALLINEIWVEKGVSPDVMAALPERGRKTKLWIEPDVSEDAMRAIPYWANVTFAVGPRTKAETLLAGPFKDFSFEAGARTEDTYALVLGLPEFDKIRVRFGKDTSPEIVTAITLHRFMDVMIGEGTSEEAVRTIPRDNPGIRVYKGTTFDGPLA